MKPVSPNEDVRFPQRSAAMASAVALLFSLPMTVAAEQSSTQFTQRLDLRTGWNAVYLEVDPGETGPSALFAGLPVDVVAAYVPSPGRAQFVENPQADLLRAYGWSVWYAPHRSDAFLGTLYAIYGAKAYLVHATTNVQWTVNGAVATEAFRWTPNAFNFVGFPVVALGGPTFRQFFEASTAHNHNKLYRLVNGTWRQVLDPGAAVMRSGEAFWIYCDGHSDYPGPLEVGTSSQLGLVLSSQSGSDLVLRNRTGHPLEVTVEHSTAGNDPVPLSVPVLAFDTDVNKLGTLQVDLGSGSWVQNLPSLEAGAALCLPFQLRLQDMTTGTRHSLLKVHTDLGTVSYIAITASRDD